MANIIICFDGTWNNPEQTEEGVRCPTNVYKIYNALSDTDNQGQQQLSYYHPGLGGEDSGVVDAVFGGALGVGIKRHICSAYRWLSLNYTPGDRIFLFGFSRGAFTVRSLAGMLGLGLVDSANKSDKELWEAVGAAYENYRLMPEQRDLDWGLKYGLVQEAEADVAVPIQFVGVWDTVGALGIPDDLEILNIFDDPKAWAFHDTSIGPHVACGRHAMALDERRSSFTVTRWDNTESHPDAQELWFAGVHADIGGGYGETDLSDIALEWMIEESRDKGLFFRAGVERQLKPDPFGVLHDSFTGVFAKMRSRPRNIPRVTPDKALNFHPSVLARQEVSPLNYPRYHPTHVLEVGQRRTVEVYADTRWNASGIYLEEGGRYIFSSSGEWEDADDVCDWQGTENNEFTRGDIARGILSFFGKLEHQLDRFGRNRSIDIYGTKRVEQMPWFSMVGAIANDSGSGEAVTNDGSPCPHEYQSLPGFQEGNPLIVNDPGYLYLFANDAWAFYGNNRGSVQVTIKRVG